MQTSRPLAALLGAILLPATALAQAVTGVGDDATVLLRGALRVRVLSEWTRAYERYGAGSPGHKDGSLEKLGVDYSLDTLGAAQFGNLLPIQSGVRALAGMPQFSASLGATALAVRNHVVSTPIALEFGLTRRVTFGITVPFVTATAEADLRVNPTGREATLGFNPTLAAASAIAANSALLAQFDSAASQLNQRLTLCLTNPSAAGCSTLNANRASALGLIATANSFATALAQLYGGRSGSAGAPFVPIAGTAAQLAIEARIASYKALYARFGSAAITGTGPLASQAPFTVADFQRMLTDSTFGLRAHPLATTISRGVGDIDFALKVNLHDSFRGDPKARLAPKGLNWRQSVGGVFRFGTGSFGASDDYLALGTGDHQNDIELRSFTDVLYGKRFWVSAVARYTLQMADKRVMRITDAPEQPMAAAYRQQTVSRDLGDEINFEITPRWTLNDHIGLAGQYAYRRKFSDSYAGRFTVTDLAGQQAVIDAATLGLETGAREHRFGGGLSYSTVAAFERGETRLPLEINYFHFQTTLGSGGRVPKLGFDRVEVRWYGRMGGTAGRRDKGEDPGTRKRERGQANSLRTEGWRTADSGRSLVPAPSRVSPDPLPCPSSRR